MLKSDVDKIKKSTRRIFSDLKNGNCSSLYYVYNIFSKRAKEQIAYAETYLNKNFKLVKNIKYNPHTEKKKRARNVKQARKNMKSYVQYQAANIYLVEKDLEKSKKYILQNLKNLEISSSILEALPHRSRKKNMQRQSKAKEF